MQFGNEEMIENINTVLMLLLELYQKGSISHSILQKNAILKISYLKLHMNHISSSKKRIYTEKILKEYEDVLHRRLFVV